MSSTQHEIEELQEQHQKPPKDIALERCEKQIEWYVNATSRSRMLFNWSQGIAIFLGGLTPILVVLLSLFPTYQGVLMVCIALFPALAAILTGLNGVFQWKEDLARFGFTAEVLKSEKAKYCTRTTDPYHSRLTEEEALNNFVRRIESIAIKETADWRVQLSETMELDKALALVNETRKNLL